MDSTPVSIGASIDWLTVTNTNPQQFDGLLALGKLCLRHSIALGNAASDWRWKQYKGYHAEGVSFGERDDSVILQLSGCMAEEWATTAYNYATNCSRIDLAVTVQYAEQRKGIADGVYSQGNEWQDKRGQGPGFTLVTNSAGGSTCYVGARISDIYGRVYDKWAETRRAEYARCWRWEMECKGEVAKRCADSLIAHPARAGAIASTVHRYFARRGAEPDWSVDTDSIKVVHIRPTSDERTRLRWLREQVRPAVAWLCERGKKQEVVDALGLMLTEDELRRWREIADDLGHNNDEGENE